MAVDTVSAPSAGEPASEMVVTDDELSEWEADARKLLTGPPKHDDPRDLMVMGGTVTLNHAVIAQDPSAATETIADLRAALDRLHSLGADISVSGLDDAPDHAPASPVLTELLSDLESRARAYIAEMGAWLVEQMQAAQVAGNDPVFLTSPGNGRHIAAVLTDTWEVATLEGPELRPTVEAADKARRTMADEVGAALAGREAGTVPAPRASVKATEEVLRTTEALIRQVLQTFRPNRPRKARARRGPGLPPRLPQETSPEVRTAAQGLVAVGWAGVEGEPGAVHLKPRGRHALKLTTESLDLSWDIVTSDDLRCFVEKLPFAAALLLYVEVGMVTKEGEVTLSISELLKAIGIETRTKKEREHWGRQVWIWTRLFSNYYVYGDRKPQRWRDPITGEVSDTTTRAPLLGIVSERMKDGQQSFDPGTPPVEVTLEPKGLIAAHRGNQKMLPQYGDIFRIARIPSGRAAGAWAQGVGVALQQRWRERADWELQPAKAPKMYRFTRRELLDTFPRLAPKYQDLLDGANPGRIGENWDGCIALLSKGEHKIIGHYSEPPRPTKRDSRKIDWNAYLDQVLTIKPTLEDREKGREVAEAGRVVRSRQARSRVKATQRGKPT